MIKIGIVDDNSVNRRNIRLNLQRETDVSIVLEASNGEDYLLQMKNLPSDKQPQLVLMDLDMPVMGGIETIAVAGVRYPEVKFLVLTVFDDDDKIFEAIRAGASGYILKDDIATLLIEAINNVHMLNGAPMSPAIARKTLQLLKLSERPFTAEIAKESSPVLDLLSDREQEILRLLVDGLDYKAIASKLFISPQTVRTHIKKIYEKLHINSKAQAILLAHKYNWL